MVVWLPEVTFSVRKESHSDFGHSPKEVVCWWYLQSLQVFTVFLMLLN